MKTLFTSLCLFFASLFSCQQKGSDFKSLSTDEFAALIADPKVQRLDVRTVAEYSEEHIPGSINIDVSDKEFETMADSVCRKTSRSPCIAVAADAARKPPPYWAGKDTSSMN